MRLVTPAVVFLAGVLVTTTSCGDDDEEAEATPRRSTTTERESTTTTLDPVEAEKQAVIAAYDAAVQARLESSAPPHPDPDHPAIAATHTSFMLDAWIDTVAGLRDTGLAFRFPENSQHRVDVDSVNFGEVEGNRVAYLEVCTVTDQEQIVVATGGVVNSGVRTVQSSEALRAEEGTWKLAEHRVNTTMEGVAGCAAD